MKLGHLPMKLNIGWLKKKNPLGKYQGASWGYGPH